MRSHLVRAALAFALCTVCIRSASAQSYYHLNMNDFAGTPQLNGSVVAYTNCTITFTYQPQQQRGFYRLLLDIRLKMNRNKSWMDKSRITSRTMLEEVLKHEQGHYIIAYLEQQELLRVLGHTRFGYDYERQAKYLFNRIDAKYKQLNIDYDEDTEHMMNHVQQNSWDMYFNKRLEYMPENNLANSTRN